MKAQIPVLIQTMTDAIFNVLETMFFLPLEAQQIVPLKELLYPPDETVIATSLEFVGNWQGYSTFSAALAPAATITANFLGVPAGAVTREQIIGTVGEITNMLTGDTFSRYDHQSLFDLSVPKVVSASELLKGTDNRGQNNITLGIHASVGPMAFQMTITV